MLSLPDWSCPIGWTASLARVQHLPNCPTGACPTVPDRVTCPIGTPVAMPGHCHALHGSAMAMPGHWHGRLMALVASPRHCHSNAMSLSAWSCCQRVKEKLHPQSRTNLKMGRIKRGSPAEVTAEVIHARILIFGPGTHFGLLERAPSPEGSSPWVSPLAS